MVAGTIELTFTLSLIGTDTTFATEIRQSVEARHYRVVEKRHHPLNSSTPRKRKWSGPMRAFEAVLRIAADHP